MTNMAMGRGGLLSLSLTHPNISSVMHDACHVKCANRSDKCKWVFITHLLTPALKILYFLKHVPPFEGTFQHYDCSPSTFQHGHFIRTVWPSELILYLGNDSQMSPSLQARQKAQTCIARSQGNLVGCLYETGGIKAL